MSCETCYWWDRYKDNSYMENWGRCLNENRPEVSVGERFRKFLNGCCTSHRGFHCDGWMDDDVHAVEVSSFNVWAEKMAHGDEACIVSRARLYL